MRRQTNKILYLTEALELALKWNFYSYQDKSPAKWVLHNDLNRHQVLCGSQFWKMS